MYIGILSPHRDDAAFSCGLLLWAARLAGLQIAIVNVFTRSDYAPYLDTDSVDLISAARRAEDKKFLSLLPGHQQAILHDLDLLDAPLRRDVAAERVLQSCLSGQPFDEDVTQLVAELQGTQVFELLLAPLAVGGHLDHAVAREAARRSANPSRLGFYEDVPYVGRLEPSKRPEAIGEALVGSALVECVLRLPQGAKIKEQLVEVYSSQIDREVVLEISTCAERFWLDKAAAVNLQRSLQGHATVAIGGPA